MVQHYYQGPGIVQESLDRLQQAFRCCGTPLTPLSSHQELFLRQRRLFRFPRFPARSTAHVRYSLRRLSLSHLVGATDRLLGGAGGDGGRRPCSGTLSVVNSGSSLCQQAFAERRIEEDYFVCFAKINCSAGRYRRLDGPRVSRTQ